MAEVQDIQVINIDNVPYAVDAMSDTAKRLVAVYNEWNQREADIRNDLMMVQAAKETLSRQIIEQVRTEKAEAEAAAVESTDEVVGEVTPDEAVVDAEPVVEAAPAEVVEVDTAEVNVTT